jgi:transposase
MLSVPAHLAIYLHTMPTDMRKGVDGLSGIIRGEFQGDPLDGALYLFVNRRGNRLKILHWDGTGFWVHYRVLERGTFEVPRSQERRVTIDATQLAMILGGVPLSQVKRRRRYARAS